MITTDLIPEWKFNYKIVIEYDGSFFHGWQKQDVPNQETVKTVQSELERAMKIALHGEPFSALQSAGRTDAGVHANGQVVNFRTNMELDEFRFKHSVSSILKGELAVLDICKADLKFNALLSAKSRRYIYKILYRAAPAVLDKGRAWHITSKLDVAKMQEAAKALIGKHDFSSFRGSGCVSKNPIKEIFSSEFIHEGDYLFYIVEGKGFLKHMVRNIVGTLIALSRGKLKHNSMQEILDAKDRKVAGPTAPAFGLYLNRVDYY